MQVIFENLKPLRHHWYRSEFLSFFFARLPLQSMTKQERLPTWQRPYLNGFGRDSANDALLSHCLSLTFTMQRKTAGWLKLKMCPVHSMTQWLCSNAYVLQSLANVQLCFISFHFVRLDFWTMHEQRTFALFECVLIMSSLQDDISLVRCIASFTCHRRQHLTYCAGADSVIHARTDPMYWHIAFYPPADKWKIDADLFNMFCLISDVYAKEKGKQTEMSSDGDSIRNNMKKNAT